MHPPPVLAAAEEAKKKKSPRWVSGRSVAQARLSGSREAECGWRNWRHHVRAHLWDMGAARAFCPQEAGVERTRIPNAQPVLLCVALRRHHCRPGVAQHRRLQLDQGHVSRHRQGRVRRGSAPEQEQPTSSWIIMPSRFGYADGTSLLGQNRQIPDCWDYVAENAPALSGRSNASTTRPPSRSPVRTSGTTRRKNRPSTPYQQEHNDLFKAILNNEPYMEGKGGAKSTHDRDHGAHGRLERQAYAMG